VKEEVLGRVGRCIYCGTSDAKLSREHIVPYGLDGPWVLEEASCPECAQITGRIEDYVLRRHLGEVRTSFGIRTRRPKERSEAVPVIVESRGTEAERSISIRKKPTFLFLPLYGWPGCTKLNPEDARGVKLKQEVTLVGWDLIKVGGPKMGTPELDELRGMIRDWGADSVFVKGRGSPEIFARFLAKIGYGFAVAKLGLDGIAEKFVLPGILGTSTDIGKWVGCDPGEEAASDAALHVINLHVSDGVIIVRIQLFSPVRTHPYLVTVGRAA
jgi:hypothetical protein